MDEDSWRQEEVGAPGKDLCSLLGLVFTENNKKIYKYWSIYLLFIID